MKDKQRIKFNIDCFDRQLIIDVDATNEEKAFTILQERYNIWNQYEDDDVQCQCCEEYMLEGLDGENIPYNEFVHVLTSELE